jgi:hypothetical protein
MLQCRICSGGILIYPRRSFIIVGSRATVASPVMERAVAEATTGKLRGLGKLKAEARATARVLARRSR